MKYRIYWRKRKIARYWYRDFGGPGAEEEAGSFCLLLKQLDREVFFLRAAFTGGWTEEVEGDPGGLRPGEREDLPPEAIPWGGSLRS